MTLISIQKNAPAIPIAAEVTGYRSDLISREVDSGAVPFDRETAYHFLRLRKSSPAREEFDSAIDDALPICRNVITPNYQYVIFGLASPGDSTQWVDLAHGIRFESQGLARVLAPARAAVFFVLTLGNEIDELIEERTVSDFPMAFIMDGVASTLLHGLLECLEVELRGVAAASDLVLGKRFSPGFHRWDLNQQRNLFDLLDPQGIGVELTEESVMVPQHSLSGVYAIGPGSTPAILDLPPSTKPSIRQS